ncbi:MAG TPA: V-type ATP synthase subunit F [Candidatus Avilachnospira avistercoris]|nr:V-type ATP synthase subunit F [Candidatus Avilachnospira avistercoris]
MYKIAVMGDRDSIYGFAAVGLEPVIANNAEEGSRKLRELVNGDYAVIYITEALASELEREIVHYSERPLPAIILIPGVSGNTGKGLSSVKRSVERAIGSDIIFGEE